MSQWNELCHANNTVRQHIAQHIALNISGKLLPKKAIAAPVPEPTDTAESTEVPAAPADVSGQVAPGAEASSSAKPAPKPGPTAALAALLDTE